MVDIAEIQQIVDLQAEIQAGTVAAADFAGNVSHIVANLGAQLSDPAILEMLNQVSELLAQLNAIVG